MNTQIQNCSRCGKAVDAIALSNNAGKCPWCGEPLPDANPEAGITETKEEIFRVRQAFISTQGLRILIPFSLLCLAAYAASDPYIELTEWSYILIPLTVVWLIYAFAQLHKASDFSMSLSDQSIRVGDRLIDWQEIVSADIKPQHGFEPAITLTCTDNSILKIPTALDGLPFVIAKVKLHVPNVTETF
jgi:hypothetical protein